MSDVLPTGEFLLYQREDAQTRVQLRVAEGTVWMTQKQLAELYQVSVPAIAQHVRNVFAERDFEASISIQVKQLEKTAKKSKGKKE